MQRWWKPGNFFNYGSLTHRRKQIEEVFFQSMAKRKGFIGKYITKNVKCLIINSHYGTIFMERSWSHKAQLISYLSVIKGNNGFSHGCDGGAERIAWSRVYSRLHWLATHFNRPFIFCLATETRQLGSFISNLWCHLVLLGLIVFTVLCRTGED